MRVGVKGITSISFQAGSSGHLPVYVAMSSPKGYHLGTCCRCGSEDVGVYSPAYRRQGSRIRLSLLFWAMMRE